MARRIRPNIREGRPVHVRLFHQAIHEGGVIRLRKDDPPLGGRSRALTRMPAGVAASLARSFGRAVNISSPLRTSMRSLVMCGWQTRSESPVATRHFVTPCANGGYAADQRDTRPLAPPNASPRQVDRPQEAAPTIQSRIGRPWTLSNGFGTVFVCGRRRVPRPAASMTASIDSVPFA